LFCESGRTREIVTLLSDDCNDRANLDALGALGDLGQVETIKTEVKKGLAMILARIPSSWASTSIVALSVSCSAVSWD